MGKVRSPEVSPSPSVPHNQRVSGNSASNLWASITYRQNLDFEELRKLRSRFISGIGTDLRTVGCHGLDDDRADGSVSARSDVTAMVWKNVDASSEGMAIAQRNGETVETQDFVERNVLLYGEGRSFA